jgi:hypothetical protein
LIPVHIQYASETYPEPDGYEAHRKLYEGSRIRPPFKFTWYEWMETYRGASEPFDCCGMTIDNGDHARFAGSWMPVAHRRRTKRMTIPLAFTLDVPYERFDSDFGDVGDWEIGLMPWPMLENLDKDGQRQAMIESLAIVQMILWSWLLLSCKNVTTVEVHPSTRRKKAKKDPTRIIYREIKVEVPSIVKARQNRAERDDEVGVAHHIRRGHFADYTKGKGLFGKYHGRYWIPPMMVGSKDYGTVLKSYALEGEHST